MLVCRRWHAIIISTPGIHFQLRIRRSTQSGVVQAFIQGRKSRFTLTVDMSGMSDEGDDDDFNAENFHECFMAASQAASRWRSLNLISPPPHGEYNDLQILQPLTHLEAIKLGRGFGQFVEPLMIAVSKTASSNLTTMDLDDPVAVLYLVRPVWLYITHSLTTLKINLSKKMDSPVDILPHLQRLKTFEAHRLSLPIYPPDASLPLVDTVQVLHLKSVSVQWMAGRVFPALEQCTIIFPHHADNIQALHVSMPTCSFLLYNSNDLQPLPQFHLPSLVKLDVKSVQWDVWRGNHQLAALYPIFTAGAQSLTSLRLEVACSTQLLVFMLRLVPSLKELWLGLASPNALSKQFFRAFIVRKRNADCTSDMVGPPSRTLAPLCPSLKSLHLDYRRWLRGPDKRALIVALNDIVESRKGTNESPFSLTLTFAGESEEQVWKIGGPVWEGPYGWYGDLALGISSAHTIIPLSTTLSERGLVPLPFKEAEYLRVPSDLYPEFFFIHDHMELNPYGYREIRLLRPLSFDLPLFYALRVLVLENSDPTFLFGHTFPKLERCRVGSWSAMNSVTLSGETKIYMPVCTRVEIAYPDLLATFELPQIRELAMSADLSGRGAELSTADGNLSRLNLLHVQDWPFNGDLIPILRSLLLLETLIISSEIYLVSLMALLPMDKNGATKSTQTSDEASESTHTNDDEKMLTLLCPRLQNLQLEVITPLVLPQRIPLINDVVSLRAEWGSPLKSFILSEFLPEHGRRFELIGKDGGFTMEETALPEEAKRFQLQI